MERDGIYSAREDEDPNCDSHAREEWAEHVTGEAEETDTSEYEEEGGIQQPLIKPAARHIPGGTWLAPVEWRTDQVKYLGVKITSKMDCVVERHFAPVLANSKRELQSMKNLHLSIVG
ncbi:hypothetical protein NDU88_011629 [Pleurodeles waltl]|uniref:Uncharacterized protein n=1 Tax=Pleurodeles waltl TaxID=8319 RepID=A0AAV7S4B4_PLEWA|nr:hypothetical protein NDU88_011629 [Pleurodeles waltl]